MTPDRLKQLHAALSSRILILDGAMGTMIQTYKLGEAEYRGERFKDYDHDVKGNNDLLVLTQPQIIQAIHEQYLDAGADIGRANRNPCNSWQPNERRIWCCTSVSTPSATTFRRSACAIVITACAIDSSS